jgi:antitoxin HicB
MAAMEPTAQKTEAIAAYLKQPYTRMVVPDSDGTYRAEILEFPGCIATGDTAAEALATLEEVAEDWLVLALERGQPIPEPLENTDYSGRLVLRLPKSLHKKAAIAAELDGVSLNQLIVASVAEYVGERSRTQIQTPFVQGVQIVAVQNTAVFSGGEYIPLAGNLVIGSPIYRRNG